MRNAALVTALGVTAVALSATSIQFWFRAQAKRSQLRRRQTSSRIATFIEALPSCSWAGAGALATVSTWLAVILGLTALAIVARAWIISPAKGTTHTAGAPQQHRKIKRVVWSQ